VTISMLSRTLAGVAILSFVGCGPDLDRTPGTMLSEGGTDRPSDGLLANPTLQHIVDLQVARDGISIMPYLRDDDPVVRARAAFALASVQEPAAVTELFPLLRDPDPAVRADAAFALGQIADSTTAPDLLDALRREEHSTVQHRLLEALGKTGDHRSLVTLTATPAMDQASVALTMGRYGIRDVHDSVTATWLAGRITADAALLRRNAAYYFGRVTETTPWAHEAENVRHALAGIHMSDAAPMHLVLGLGRLEEPQDAALIAARLRMATDWRVRASAARALGDIAPDSNLPTPLLHALDDVSRHVAINAAGGIARFSPIPATNVARVTAWVEGHADTWHVAAPLLEVLAANGEWDLAQGVVEQYEAEGNAAAVRAAMGAIGRTPDRRAFALLREYAALSQGDGGAAAVAALRTRWNGEDSLSGAEEYYDVFAQALRSGEIGAARAAAQTLGGQEFRELGSVELLQDVFNTLGAPADSDRKVAIIQTFGRMNDESTLATLRAASEDDNDAVRGAAAAALARRGPQAGRGPARTLRTIDWEYLERIGPRPQLILETEKGTITLELVTEEAPLTVQTVVQLAEAGNYDNVPYHRVVSNFVVQGGDISQGTGPAVAPFVIRSEFTRIPYERGVVGVASSGKDTETSQYFITHVMSPHLDGRYTAFGWVVNGLDVVDRIYQGDRLVRARVVRGGG
jgi:peptidylprolyl isomerase